MTPQETEDFLMELAAVICEVHPRSEVLDDLAKRLASALSASASPKAKAAAAAVSRRDPRSGR